MRKLPLICAVMVCIGVGDLSNASERVIIRKPRVHKKLTHFRVVATVMTSNTGGNRLASGEKNTANKTHFVALPHRSALGRTIGIYAHKTGIQIHNIPVKDLGPWSLKDNYWVKGTRPLAERGVSDKYGKARNKAGIDLSRKLAESLGLGYPYKGEVTWWFE